MDKLDRNILLELVTDSRTNITKLARKVRSSREVVDYRIKKLLKKGVIKKFIAEIDVSKLGFVGAAVFLTLKADKHRDFISYIKKCDYVSWVAQLSGTWSFGLSIYAKSNEELDQNLRKLIYNFEKDVIDYRFLLHKKSSFYYKRYFDVIEDEVSFSSKTIEVDFTDKKILEMLSENSRVDVVDISKKVKLSAPAVASRIRKLKQNGIIPRYSVFINISKLNLYQYSVFVNYKDKNMVKYLSRNKHVSFIVEYVGDECLEYGIVCKSPYALRDIINNIEEKFPENRVFEISMFQKEFISIGAPKCVFD